MVYVKSLVVLEQRDTNSRFDTASRALFHQRMDDTPAENCLPNLLLEAEAAALLRCSRGHVKRLRLERKLGYIPGRPVTIMQKDLEIYVASAKVRRVKARGKSKAFEFISAGASPKPFALLTWTEAAVKFERTRRQIRYMCLQGRVPYILGHPALIDEADLAEYFEGKRLTALAKIPPAPGTPEFEALQDRKAEEKMRHRLRVIRTRREVARILKDMEARASTGTVQPVGGTKGRK